MRQHCCVQLPGGSSPSLTCFEKGAGPCPAHVGFQLSLLQPCCHRLPSFCLLRFGFSLMAAFVSLLSWGCVPGMGHLLLVMCLVPASCWSLPRPVCVCCWRGRGDSLCRGAARCRAAPGLVAEWRPEPCPVPAQGPHMLAAPGYIPCARLPSRGRALRLPPCPGTLRHACCARHAWHPAPLWLSPWRMLPGCPRRLFLAGLGSWGCWLSALSLFPHVAEGGWQGPVLVQELWDGYCGAVMASLGPAPAPGSLGTLAGCGCGQPAPRAARCSVPIPMLWWA